MCMRVLSVWCVFERVWCVCNVYLSLYGVYVGMWWSVYGVYVEGVCDVYARKTYIAKKKKKNVYSVDHLSILHIRGKVQQWPHRDI